MKGLRKAVPILGLLLFATTLAVSIRHHEPWRDEIQAWLLARDSHSLAELWHNSRYEGHPLLWHVLLFFLTRFTSDPTAMQGLHWLIACANAGLLLFIAPFPLWLRLVWCFSYFPFFEYGVIARNYALTVSWLIIFAAFAAAGKKGAATLAAGLAANTSPMGLLLAPMATPLIWDGMKRASAIRNLIFLSLLGSLAAFQCLPPADYEHARGAFWGWDSTRFAYVMRNAAAATFPLPRPQLHFWNTSLLFGSGPEGSSALAGWLAAGSFGFWGLWVLASLRRVKVAAWSFALGWLALVLFFYVKFPGATRHHGFFLIWSVAMLWVANGRSDVRVGVLPLTVSLLVGLAGTAVAFYWDYAKPFSSGKELGLHLSRCPDLPPLVGHPDWAALTVAGYLPKKTIFYPTRGAFGTFVVWDLFRAQRENLAEGELLRQSRHADNGKGVILIANQPLSSPRPCEPVFIPTATIVPDETLWAYWCRWQ